MTAAPAASLYEAVVGQDAAVAELRAAARAPVHAYLLVGAPGTGKRAAARAFAASLLCRGGGCAECRDCRLALAGRHPDLVLVERTGALVTVAEARDVARIAARSPIEGHRQVIVLADFHLVDKAAPALLKTVEEPPATTFFVLLADRLVPELATIASRCVTVPFVPLALADVEGALVAEGIAPPDAHRVAEVAGGRLDRARLLAADPELAARLEGWRSLPGRLDGTGATVAILAEELLASSQAASAGLQDRQRREADELARRAEASGEALGAERREMEERHRREQRRARTDDLRLGLAVLQGAYRRGLGTPDAPAAVAAVSAVEQAARALDRNPNEALLLQALLVQLSGPLALGSLGARRPG